MMPESAASMKEKRTVRLCENSGCEVPLPEGARKDRRFCSARCRTESGRHRGTIGSARRLKCGTWSYTIHGPENNLRPGDEIEWRKVTPA